MSVTATSGVPLALGVTQNAAINFSLASGHVRLPRSPPRSWASAGRSSSRCAAGSSAMPRSSRDVLRAQAQAAAVLGATLESPGASLLAPPPRARRRIKRRCPRRRPCDSGPADPTSPPWSTVVFMNGATPDGRTHPTVLRLGTALAGTGHLALIPDLPGIAGGELSPATLAASIGLTADAVTASDVAQGRVALAGVSIGASLALLTRRAHAWRRISAVVCVAPYGDLAKVMLLATTETYCEQGRLVVRYPVPPYLAVGLARSLAAMLPPSAAAIDLLRRVASHRSGLGGRA